MKKLAEASIGLVNLAAKEGSLYKKSLLCHTGEFQGMFGSVVVTQQDLEQIAKRYNETHADPANENDFAPILKDHIRDADLNKGRVMADLNVEPWKDPETGKDEFALYGTLRVDRDQDKVESGQYSQLSISFDEETYELFEVSFVAVEAARRSQVLSKGGNKMTPEQMLAAMTEKHNALSARIDRMKTLRQGRKAIALALGESVKSTESDIVSLQKKVGEIMLGIKAAGLKGQFRGFVAQGKMTKAEFDGLKFSELASAPASALSAVVKAYGDRTPSSDVIQHGQMGAKAVDLSSASPEEMRNLIALQKSGKRAALSEGGEAEKDKKDKKEGEALESEGADQADKDKKDGKKDAPAPASMEDMDEHIKAMESIGPAIEKACSYLKSMHESLKKLEEMDDEKESA